MTDYSGRKIQYALGIESIVGTAVQPTNAIRWETADFYDKATDVLNASALGVLDKYSGAEVVQQWSDGQIAGKVTDESIGYIFLSLMGGYSKTTHAGETVVYDHTFSESQANQPPTLTIVRTDPNTTLQYTGATVKSMEVSVVAGDYIRQTTNFVGQPSAASTYVSTYEPENEFIPKNCTVKFAANQGGIGGASAIPLHSIKLTVDKGVEPYYIIGQNNPSVILADTTEIKGEMMLRYSAQTYYNLRFNNTPQYVQVTIINTAVTIGSTTNPTIQFTMPLCYLNDWKIDQSLDGIVQQTIDFEATFYPPTQNALSILLTNIVKQYEPYLIS